MQVTVGIRLQYVIREEKRLLDKSLGCSVLHGSHTDFARIFIDDWGKIGGSWGFLPYEMYKIVSKTLTEPT